MPIFEYTCRKCNEVFTVLRLGGAEEEITCSKCGSKDVVKRMSVFGCSIQSGHAGSPSGGFSVGG